MHRRTAIVATALGLGILLLAGGAEARRHPRSTGRGQCIGEALSAKKACIAGCVDSYQSDFEGCFGSGSSCAQNCLTARLSCESGPYAAIHACAGAVTNPDSCRSQLKTALAACKSDPAPLACANAAQVTALKCRQDCVDAQASALDTCRMAFRLCLHGCPSSPSGAFLDGEM